MKFVNGVVSGTGRSAWLSNYHRQTSTIEKDLTWNCQMCFGHLHFLLILRKATLREISTKFMKLKVQTDDLNMMLFALDTVWYRTRFSRENNQIPNHAFINSLNFCNSWSWSHKILQSVKIGGPGFKYFQALYLPRLLYVSTYA